MRVRQLNDSPIYEKFGEVPAGPVTAQPRWVRTLVMRRNR